ncbi:MULTISPECIES: recombinase family protein [unclassified Pseudomonas]|uniref:recombinase family protein n=1 Tax=unclassified Pseudomonas TaxID=196821 RepID=UPI00224888BF|nr:recombinase family protein [Pseudomonas sp. DCB_BG]MCX2708367.1 recombinase family protein [Pseudomonas sp. DCB_BG]
MPQAISYVRFSSLRQSKGTSVERQEQMIGQWLSQHPDYDLSALQYKDLGKSGYKGEHVKGGGFGKLLMAIEAGAIKPEDVVLVEAIDRTGRLDAVDMLGILHPILSAGVSIVTLDDGQTYNRESLNGAGLFILSAKIQSAHQYSAALSRRIKASYESRRKAAKEKGITPERYTPVWLTSKGELIEPVAEQIRVAFDLYISGVGTSAIAKRLRECGVPELAKVAGASVRRWINNRAAIGEWDGVAVYPPVVSLSTFQKAQLHKEKVKTVPAKKTGKHFLVGLMKCGVCGKNYIVQHRKGKTSSVRCRLNQMAGDCTNTAQLPLPIIQALMAHCADDWKQKAVASLNTGVNEAEIAALRVEVEQATAKIKGLTDSVMALGALPELVGAMKENNEAREKALASIAILERTVIGGESWVATTNVWKLEQEDPQRLSSLLEQVGFSITINPDKTFAIAKGPAVWKYRGKDRSSNRFVLDNGHKLFMIARDDFCDTGVVRRDEFEDFENDLANGYRPED